MLSVPKKFWFFWRKKIILNIKEIKKVMVYQRAMGVTLLAAVMSRSAYSK